jgi:peptide deformylase
MNTPEIQFGSTKVTKPIDEKAKLITTTTYRNGVGISTNQIVVRDRIPTSRPTLEQMEKIVNDLFYNPDKINPSIAIESHSNSEGVVYDLVIGYTILQVE